MTGSPDPSDPAPLSAIGLPTTGESAGGGGPTSTNLNWENLPSWDAFIGQACVPIFPSATLPDFYIGGIRAQVESVTRNGLDEHTVVEVIGPVRNTSNVWDLDETGTVDPPATPYADTPLDNLKLEMEVFGHSGIPFQAPVKSGTSTVLKNGDYLKETKYFTQFEGTLGVTDKVLCAHSYVTQRSDKEIFLWNVRIANGAVTDSLQPSGDWGQTGDIYFKSIDIIGLPTGWRVVCDAPRDSMDLGFTGPTGNQQLMKDLGTDTWNFMATGQAFVYRFAVCRDADVSLATELLRKNHYAYATGYNSYYRRRNWGEQQILLPTPTTDVSFGGLTGHAALDNYFNGLFVEAKATVAFGVTSFTTDFKNPALGWSHPYGDPQGRAPSGSWKNIHTGWANTQGEWNLATLMLDQDHHRMHRWKLDPTTGESQTIHTIAAAHGGQLPWDTNWGSTHNNTDIPAMQHPNSVGESGTANPVPSLPTTKVWNNLSGASTCPYDYDAATSTGLKWYLVGGSVALTTYMSWDAAHMLRAMVWARSPIWALNDSVAKDWMGMCSSHFQFCTSSIPISTYSRTTLTVPPGQTLVANVDVGRYGDLTKYRTFVLANPGYGGISGRSTGEVMLLYTAEYLTASLTRRAELKDTLTKLIEILDAEKFSNEGNERRSEDAQMKFIGPEFSSPYTHDYRGIMGGGQVWEMGRTWNASFAAAQAAHSVVTDPVWIKAKNLYVDGTQAVHSAYPSNIADHQVTYTLCNVWILHPWGNASGGSSGVTDYPVGATVTFGGNSYRCNTEHDYTGIAAEQPGGASGYWTLDNTITDREPRATMHFIPADQTDNDWWGWPISFTDRRSSEPLVKAWRATGDNWYLERAKQSHTYGLLSYEDTVTAMWSRLTTELPSGGQNVWNYEFHRYAETLAELQFANSATSQGTITAAGAGAVTTIAGVVTRTGTLRASAGGAATSIQGHGASLTGTIVAVGGGASATLAGKVTRTGTLAATGGGASATLTGVVGSLSFSPNTLKVVKVTHANVADDWEVTVTYG